MSVINVKNVTKYYGKTCALENVSLTIESGKIYGLLGRNGAGKTTLLNLMTNRLFPTEGEITIDGENVYENDNAIGKVFLMTEMELYPAGMKIKDIFKWTKEFYPSFDIEYANALCEKFELDPNKKKKSLSTGYNTISKLITTLASNAEIMMFDEPVLGLDAHHRELFYKELLSAYIQKPKTIVISTHIIEEISDILERVIIISGKKVIADESVEELLEKAYCVTGSAENVDKFIKDKNCINAEKIGTLKSATIAGILSDNDRQIADELKLELSKVELQKLFIYLTNPGGAK